MIHEYKCVYCSSAATVGNKCEVHAKQPEHIGRRERRKTKRRSGNAKRYADSRWRELSRRFLRDNPYCARCLMLRDRQTFANHVDHIKALTKFPDLKYDHDNLQSLCVSCHSTKSNHERRGHYYDYVRGREYIEAN